MIEFPSLKEEDAQTYLLPPDPSYDALIETVESFYQDWGRSFVFRDRHDPYSVLLSEVMLQQTQTSRVVEKYRYFLSRWPSFKALAHAPLEEILIAWKGLGYNRRALNLKKTAEKTEAWNWTIPNDHKAMLTLPGVGKATAAALLAFCYQEKSIYLETNIRRVLLYYYFHDQTDVHDRVLEAILAKIIVLVDDPRSWYYALMDYGVLLKALVPNPNTKSAHYAKQSRFEGSKRQVRAALLHHIAEHGPVSLPAVSSMLREYDSKYLDQSIEELLKEGFLLLREGYLSIR
ncbi:MAG: DNA repair protein [Spirochaetales bacterium]|jgi:A/G-specific adenine glycosylase|nr:DNA repair protein [Spirochaetales bacterium]